MSSNKETSSLITSNKKIRSKKKLHKLLTAVFVWGVRTDRAKNHGVTTPVPENWAKDEWRERGSRKRDGAGGGCLKEKRREWAEDEGAGRGCLEEKRKERREDDEAGGGCLGENREREKVWEKEEECGKKKWGSEVIKPFLFFKKTKLISALRFKGCSLIKFVQIAFSSYYFNLLFFPVLYPGRDGQYIATNRPKLSFPIRVVFSASDLFDAVMPDEEKFSIL